MLKATDGVGPTEEETVAYVHQLLIVEAIH